MTSTEWFRREEMWNNLRTSSSKDKTKKTRNREETFSCLMIRIALKTFHRTKTKVKIFQEIAWSGHLF